MADVVQMLVPWALTTSVLFAIVGWDERRLSPDRRDRAWPAASRISALVVFGVVALPIHFTRTRRSIGGFLLGVGAMALVVVLDLVVEIALDAALAFLR